MNSSSSGSPARGIVRAGTIPFMSLCLALSILSCARPVEVAILTKLEAGSIVGSSELNAARLFVEDRGDRQLRFKAFDDGWDPLKTVSAFAEARREGIRFVITSHPSNCALAIADAANGAGVLTLITGATTAELSGRDDLILRVVPDLAREQSWMAERVAETGASSVLVVRDTDNEAYTRPAYDYFAAALAAAAAKRGGGAPRLRELLVSVNGLDLEGLRSLMEAEAYDLCYILAGSYKSAAGGIAQLSAAVAPDAPIFFTPWMRTPALVETAGPALAQARMGGHLPSRGRDPALDAYIDRFEKRFGYRPTAVSVYVYGALSLLAEAFEAGARTPEEVKARLLSRGKAETPFFTFEFDEYGDAVMPFHLIEDIAGEF